MADNRPPAAKPGTTLAGTLPDIYHRVTEAPTPTTASHDQPPPSPHQDDQSPPSPHQDDEAADEAPDQGAADEASEQEEEEVVATADEVGDGEADALQEAETGVQQHRTDGGVLYMETDEDHVYMISDNNRTYCMDIITGDVRQKQNGDWVPYDAEADVAGLLGGTSSAGSTEQPAAKASVVKRNLCHRVQAFKRTCLTGAGYRIGTRDGTMVTGCGRTCVADAVTTCENALKQRRATAPETARVRRWFRNRHAGDPNQLDVQAYVTEHGMHVHFLWQMSPKNLLKKRAGAFLVRLDYSYMHEGVLCHDTHYIALIDGVLIDNNKNQPPLVITYEDMKDNFTAVRPFRSFFDAEVTQAVTLTHVYEITLRSSKRVRDE